MSTTGIIGTSLTAVEAALEYGGDYQLTASGDLAIVQDTALYPYATIQRVTFLILTNPVIPNITNTASGEPDDIFNHTYGAGARAYVGRSSGSASVNIEAMQNNIQSGLAADPYIAQNPKPTVTFSSLDNYVSSVLCTVSFTTISGVNGTVTDIPVGGGPQ